MHLITGLNTGGAEMMLYKLSKYKSDKVEYLVVSLTNLGPISEKIKETGVRVEALHMKKGPKSIKGLITLFKLIKEFRPNIIQTWLYHADLIGALYGVITRTPVYWNIRQEKINLKLNKWHTVLTFRLCILLSFIPKKIITCSSQAIKFHVQKGYPKNKFIQIYNGFELEKFTPPNSEQINNSFGRKLIIHIGRFAPLKNHKGFIDVANEILKKAPSTKFEMYGDHVDSKNSQLMEYIQEKGLHKAISLKGRSDSIHKVYRESTILISTSFSEGFPNTIGEAMASGTPVLTTRAGDSEMIVDNKENVFNVRDIEQIADRASNLLSNFEEYSANCLEARKQIESHFDIKVIGQAYEKEYLSISSQGK